jgi:hypothetical protein
MPNRRHALAFFDLFSWRRPPTEREMPCNDRASVLRKGALVSESSNLKHALECMRLEADCMQLASDPGSPALQSHFLLMAGVWNALAVRDASANTQIEQLPEREIDLRDDLLPSAGRVGQASFALSNCPEPRWGAGSRRRRTAP